MDWWTSVCISYVRSIFDCYGRWSGVRTVCDTKTYNRNFQYKFLMSESSLGGTKDMHTSNTILFLRRQKPRRVSGGRSRGIRRTAACPHFRSFQIRSHIAQQVFCPHWVWLGSVRGCVCRGAREERRNADGLATRPVSGSEQRDVLNRFHFFPAGGRRKENNSGVTSCEENLLHRRPERPYSFAPPARSPEVPIRA